MGRLPRKVLWLIRSGGAPSDLTCEGVLPTIRASDWAKKLEASILKGELLGDVGLGWGWDKAYFWWVLLATGLWDSAARMKSVGISFVPWWRSWKKECWALVAGSPKRIGPVL